MRKVVFKLVSRILCLGLGGCASFSGMPTPLVTVAQMDKITERYSVDTALENYHSANPADRRGMTPRQWRDVVIGLYVANADARYLQFRAALAKEAKGAAFGLDSGVLALTSIGAVVSGGTANVLSAAAAGLTGARASLSKEVYFEKTLPALIAGMDASRTSIRTQIFSRLAGTDESKYPLEMALADLNAYQLASSLEAGIQQVTVAATAKAAEEQAKFDVLYVAAPPTDDASVLMLKIKVAMGAWVKQNKAAALRAAITASGSGTKADPATDPGAVFQDVIAQLAQTSYTSEKLTSFMQNVTASSGETF